MTTLEMNQIFQFHNGLIKIPVAFGFDSIQRTFQFHNGLIKI